MSKAYVHDIRPSGSGEGEEASVDQANPGWVLTCVRWKIRDTQRTQAADMLGTLPILIIENDCISVSTVTSKSSPTPSVEITLKITDTNYLTALAPGDFIFVNMFQWDTYADNLVTRIKNSGNSDDAAINGKTDGFKGFFKIQSVRETIMVDAESGTKSLVVKVTGFAFTEFNNTIYFNPNLISDADRKNELLFASNVAIVWQKLITAAGVPKVQDILAVLIQGLIGVGPTGEAKSIGKGMVVSPNTHFFVPLTVGRLLGQKNAKAAKDLYNYLFGIQDYSAGDIQDLQTGMNPRGLNRKYGGRFYYTPNYCEGQSYIKAEYWNSVKTWSILSQYTNSPLNELYNCFRVDPSGRVMPTVVFRQIPFSTEEAAKSQRVTKFTNLPRWRIDPALVMNYDLGRDEAARVNFVQFFGASANDKNGTSFAIESALRNYVYDVQDVQRSGLRPYVVSTIFDEISPQNIKAQLRSPQWAKILGDCLVGGHLKMNGTLVCYGIQDPIAAGDNLEFNGIVYHIEQVEHTGAIDANGKKIFRTKLALSNGVSVDSENGPQAYAEMTYSIGYADRKDDFNNRDQILPGISEAQDTVSRRSTDIDIGEDTRKESPFQQPNKTAVKQPKNKK